MFAFREFLEHVNVTFNDNGTISFNPVRIHIPRPDLSVGDLQSDIIITPNLGLLGASTLAAEFSSFASFGLATLVKSMKVKPFLNLRVYDFLFGHDDDLVRLASHIVPSLIPFDRLGYMDQVGLKFFYDYICNFYSFRRFLQAKGTIESQSFCLTQSKR